MSRSDVWFESSGDRCAAWLYRPDGGAQASERVPCVILAHGFAGTRVAGLDRFAEYFAAHGLAALAFDYRHFGDSEGTPRQLLDVGRQLADWSAAIRIVRALDGVDPERIALWGTSFGAGHALVTAAGDRRIAAVVAQAPFVDGLATLAALRPLTALRLTGSGVRDAVGALLGRPPHMLPAVGPPGTLAAMTSPDAEPGYRAIIPDGADWINAVAARVILRIGTYRPGRAVPRIACPVLYVIADEDAITPPSAAARAARRTTDHEVVRHRGGHFEVYVGPGFKRIAAAEAEFLARHLLGDGPAASEPR